MHNDLCRCIHVHCTGNDFSLKNSQMAYTNYVKLPILHHHFQGLKPYTIAKELQKEGISIGSNFSR